MKNLLRVGLFFLLLSLASCGKFLSKFDRLSDKEKSMTTLIFSAEHQDRGLFALDSGIMIYAVNTVNPDSRGAFKLSSTDDAKTWTIPTGKYNFYAVGWPASSTVFTGNMFCSSVQNVSLIGGEKEVVFTMRSDACAAPPFVPNSSFNIGTAISKMQFVSSSSGGTLPNSDTIKITLPEYQFFGGGIDVSRDVGGGITSSPLSPADWNGLSTPSLSLFLPIGAEGDLDNPFLIGFKRTTGSPSVERFYGYKKGLIKSGDIGQLKLQLDGVDVSPSAASNFLILAPSAISSRSSTQIPLINF